MSNLFLKIINMSISASWLVLAVLLLRFVLKKAPKWVNVLLWGIVAVRLAFPFSIESALSLIPSAETISPGIMMETVPSVQTGVPAINSVINPVIGSSLAPTPGASANPLQIWIPIFSIVWGVGVAALLLYTAVSYWRLQRKVSEAVILRDNIYQSENVTSPFVLGIFKPRIYLPYNMDGQELGHVVAHEHAHIRRRDHWWKPLGFLLLTIHWFNPLMWLAYVLLCRDIELACDEKVIKEMGNEQRADYTQALVTCSVNRRMIAACPLAFGEVGVKERVKSVMNYKRPAFWVIVLAVIACVVVAVCFLTDPEQDSYTLRIVVPAGSQEDFVYSDEEVSTTGDSIVIWSGDGLGDTEVLLSPVDKTTETGYTATYLTHEMPVEFDAEKDTWFKVGINMQNPTDEDIVVYVEVENIEIRISDESAPNRITFKAEVLEIHEGYFLVAPETSWALNSTDRIEVPLMNMDPALEPQVGDTIEIVCSGEILETYPARLSNVYSIRVAEETSRLSLNDVIILSQYGYDLSWSDFENYDYIETGSGLYIRVYEINEMYELWIGGAGPDSEPMYIYLTLTENSDTRIDIRDGEVTEFISECNAIAEGIVDLIPMVMVDGNLYLDTGLNSNVDGRSGVMDGEITSEVDGSQRPTENNQSNFGTGYGYQFGATEGTIEIYMNEEWWIFATEKVRDTLHFPTTERAFEFDFAGNTSGGQKMELTEIYPYWCIEIDNTGNGTIQMEIQDEVYRVEAGTNKIFCSDEKWEAGTYTVSFSTTGYQPMQGSAICTRSKAPMTDSQATSASTYNVDSDIPQMGFAGLEHGDTLVDKEVIEINSNGVALEYQITYSRPTIILEVGVVDENGTEFSVTIQHGSGSGIIEDIPAGNYQLFVRNVGYTGELPGKTVEGGAMICKLIANE